MASLPQEAITAIQSAGFSVYQRGANDSYAYFTDGKNIGYIQNSDFGGFDLSTVHIANTSTGTGFGLYKQLSADELTSAKLSEAFIFAPSWANTTKGVKKWRDMNHFLSSGSWNAGFSLRQSS